MSITSLTERISELIERNEFCRLGEALENGENVSVDGVFGGGCAFVAAGIKRHISRSLLVVRALPETIDSTADDLLLFTGQQVLTFPPLETLNINELVGDDLFGQRTRLLKTLDTDSAQSANAIIVTSISALMQPVPSRELLRERSRTLQTGDTLDLELFVAWLVEGGYHPMPAIDLPGEFARRGHLLDIFAPDWEQPIRIEFFGDEIESIRTFDLATQRSLETVKSVTL
ncbi:MAG: transcription-repair coupling factor, partial [Planctomycetaceae bacterium]|nr:transcription-repair coupling factor [Planctomycetaceae bacterium]